MTREGVWVKLGGMPGGATPHILILGGGFAGLTAARTLAKAPVRITLIDRRNHHLFQPLLYQVATAALSPSHIATPLRKIFRGSENVTVLLGEATSIEVSERRLVLADDVMPYDYLVVATGATHSYFGHDEWARHATGLKSIEDALEMRRRIFLAFEAAERETDPAEQAAWLTFVIVGGGPTGVELAGSIAEIARRTLVRDFRHIDPRQARIIMVERQSRLLPTYPEKLSAWAEKKLRSLGVEVRTHSQVTAIEGTCVLVDAESISTRTVLWSAGVKASPLAVSLGVPLDRAGRVLVQADLSLPGHPEVYVIGDLAALEQQGALIPGVAPAAIQEGRHVARNILRQLGGEPTLPFVYRDKGSLATIGRAAAVAHIRRIQTGGFFAWLLWLFIHILYLVGFRNRVVVLSEWAWAFWTWERDARLITNEPHPLILRGKAAETPTKERAQANS